MWRDRARRPKTRARHVAARRSAKALEARAAELAAQQGAEQPERTTPADLDTLRRELRAVLENVTPVHAKTILPLGLADRCWRARLFHPRAAVRC